MRFMMLMIPKGYENATPGTTPDRKAVEAMMKYNETLQKAGFLLALDGLHPPSAGARVSFAGGKPKVTDGPFAEANDVIGDYWMIQVKSKAEAIEWASRCPASENEVIEIRQVFEMEDCPFDNNAEEAMNFYVSIFKNSKIGVVSRYGDNGPGPKGTVMTATFELERQEFMALNGGPHYTFSPAASYFVNCETQQEVDKLWEKLSAGGQIQQCG